MFPFWEDVIEPSLNAAEPKRIVEIGAEQGRTTRLLLAWAAEHGTTVVAIDPSPRFDVARWQLENPRFEFHHARSHDALGTVGAVDVALIDGDHNYFTVAGELRLLAASAERAGEPLPLVIAHDAGWPYGRRDMYYDPRSIPDEHRHDAARAGLLPGRAELGSPGINAGLWNATREGGARNGVLTAIEDFAGELGGGAEPIVIEGMHGLALLASAERIAAAPRLRDELARLRSAEFARAWSAKLEQARIGAELRAQAAAQAGRSAERRLAERDHGLLDEPGGG